MASSTASETLISFVLYAGVAILGISLLMMLFVVLFRLWSIAKNRQFGHFHARWKPILNAIGQTIPATLPAIRQGEQFLFLKLWSDTFEHADPPTRENLLELAHHLHLETISTAMLGHKSGDHKMLAMRTIGYLGNASAQEQLISILEHPNPLFSLLAARALITIDAAATLPLLMPYFLEKREWQTNKILLILSDLKSDLVTQALTGAIPTCSDACLPRLIKLFTLMPDELARNKALELLNDDSDPEIIAACLHYMNLPEDKPLLTEYLSHDAWVVRMHAVKAMAPLLSASNIALLFPLLNDPAWWVRFHSARAIVLQPFADERYLDRLDASLVDRYAKDALRQARSKRSVFEHL